MTKASSLTFTEAVEHYEQHHCSRTDLQVVRDDCEALKHSYIRYSIKSHKLHDDDPTGYHQKCIEKLENGESDYSYEIEKGRKYLKIMMVIDHGPNRLGESRSVHAFIDKNTGEVYKAASWRGPARNGVRFDLRLIESRERLYECCDWAGGHLHK